MKKTLAAALLLSCAAVAFATGARSAVLEKDTEVLVKVQERLTPRTVKAGDIVLFTVAYPVKNKARQVVIEQSADAWGTIVRVPEYKALSTDEPDWEQRPEWQRPDRKAQLERERARRAKLRARTKSPDTYPRLKDKNWGTLGITIDRATMVTGKDVALIADVAREDSHTMITLDRRASFDIAQMYREQKMQRERAAKGQPTSPDQTVSRDITLAIPWNVFTTGTLSVVEPGTVLRARVLADIVVSEDPKPEVKKPIPKPPRKVRKPRVKPKPKLGRCPCCFLCDCEQRTGKPCPAASGRPCKPAPAPAQAKSGCTCSSTPSNGAVQNAPNGAAPNQPANTPAPNAPNNAVQNVPANSAPKEPEVKPLSGAKPFAGATVTDISGDIMPMI